MSENYSKVCGIDLGTGNSAVAVINELGDVIVAPNESGSYTTPSIVLFDKGERLVGESAKRKMVMNPEHTISFIKRFMGADYNDPDVQKMLSKVTYKVENKDGRPAINIDDKLYTPEEISAIIVSTMKKTAENYYGQKVDKAVITVPAFFNDSQRQATKLAGELAGLEVLRIINEPTAAILASDIDTKEDKIVAVVDLGCGTGDVSIVEISDIDGETMYEVLASYGDVFLGGQDYDNALVTYICDEFQKSEGVDLRKDPMAYSRVIAAAEKAKIELSGQSATEINEPYITVVDNVPKMLTMSITRAKFEQLTEDLTERAVDLARVAIEKSGKSVNDINCILLVGGSTRIPAVQEALIKTFGLPLNKSVNPDQAVALGAAIQANTLSGNSKGKGILLLDVTPLSVGIETEGGVMTVMVPANTTTPTEKTETFTTAADNQSAVQIMVYQGERAMCADNKLIGQFMLDGILPARRGVPQIAVTFSINADGILEVTAKDKATGKEQHITIQNQTLSDAEIERIKKDAEANAAADEKKRQEIEEYNKAESYGYLIKNAMDKDEIKGLVTEDEIKNITVLADELIKVASEKKSIDNVNAAKKKLEEAYVPVAQKIYAQSEPNTGQAASENTQQPGASSCNTAFDGNVQDVQFEEVK